MANGQVVLVTTEPLGSGPTTWLKEEAHKEKAEPANLHDLSAIGIKRCVERVRHKSLD